MKTSKPILGLSMLLILISVTIPSACFSKDNQSYSATGTWAWTGPKESGGYLLTILKKNKVQFQLELQRGAPSYNSGFIKGEFELQGNKGTFRTDEFGPCDISFEIRKNEIVITQPANKADCGFGYGVYPEGTYKCLSHKQPKFSAGDPRASE